MKKIVISVLAAGLLLMGVPVTAQVSSDKGFMEGDSPNLATGQIVDGDYFTSGDVVRISGTINGDLYASGGQIEIDGIVKGDVMVAGGQVMISGTVGQDVRAAGGDVVVSGRVGKNVTVAGGNVNLARKGDIRGNVVAFAGELNVASVVGGNLKGGAGNVVLDNEIHGDVELAAESVRVNNQAQVRGDISYMSGLEAEIDRGATVTGEVTRFAMPAEVDFERGFNWIGLLITLVSVFIIGLLIVNFYPNFTEKSMEALNQRPVAAFLWGLIAIVVTPIAALLLVVSLIGMPMGLIALAIYFIYLYVSKIFVAVWAGASILRRYAKNVSLSWALILGLVLYYLLALIPGISFFFGLMVAIFGLGMTLIARKDLMEQLRKKKLV